MKHRKRTRNGEVVLFCLTSIYFFVGMFIYLIFFFLKIGSANNWIETFFLIYGLIGMLFIAPYILGMFGRIVIPCDDEDECGCELDYYDEDECVEERKEKKEVTPKRNTSTKKTTTKRKENKK